MSDDTLMEHVVVFITSLWPCRQAFLNKVAIGGIVVSIGAFQGVDQGLIAVMPNLNSLTMVSNFKSIDDVTNLVTYHTAYTD